ncbi:hypothetical protein Q7P35_009581 [Cladosporium inversicolor]
MSKKNLFICFDAFGTLFTPRRPVAQQYSEVARSFGLGGFSDDDIAKSFKNAFKYESIQNPNYGKATGLGAEKWWSNIIHNTFKHYYQPGQDQAPTNLIPSLIHRFHSKEGYTLYPDVLPLLKQLKSPNHQAQQHHHPRVVIGIITNSDNRTADILTSLGVHVNPLHYGDQPSHSSATQTAAGNFDIDFTVLSYDVGFEKPSRAIFAAADETLASLLSADHQKVNPDEWRKVYVGDEYEKDIVGATQAGWKAVLVDRERAGDCDGVEWLHGDEPADVLAVLERTKAVGFSSLGQLGEWLPGRG